MGTATARSDTDDFGRSLYRDADRHVVDKVGEIAGKRGVPRAQVALAWLLAQEPVDAPIVGATKNHHLDDAVAAVNLEPDDTELGEFDGLYEPRGVAGHA